MSVNTTITFRNNFHNREASVQVRDGQISAGQYNRLRRTLCGHADCKCDWGQSSLEPIYGFNHRIIGYRVDLPERLTA